MGSTNTFPDLPFGTTSTKFVYIFSSPHVLLLLFGQCHLLSSYFNFTALLCLLSIPIYLTGVVLNIHTPGNMPPPSLVPLLSYDHETTISNVSVIFDASVFKVWRDSTELGVMDPKYPYWAMDLQVAGWPTFSSTLLGRYCGGKLVKGALYQLRGRFFLKTSRLGQESYLHIDEAVRFQGPGTIRSIKTPQFFMVADITSVTESSLTASWVTKNPYRKNMIQEQHAIISLENSSPDPEHFRGQQCCLEGRMDSVDHMRDWVCAGISLC